MSKLYQGFSVKFLVLALFFPLFIFAQNNLPEKQHEITLYIIPSMHPLDWSSPASLYKSMKECYLKTIGLPDNYLLGHMTVRLESPMLDKPVIMAQTSGSVEEKTDLVLKQKVGFGIMGAALTGRIETENEIEHKLKVYAKREKLAFLKYKISEKAMKRILAFIDTYKQKINEKNAACDFYGGAFLASLQIRRWRLLHFWNCFARFGKCINPRYRKMENGIKYSCNDYWRRVF